MNSKKSSLATGMHAASAQLEPFPLYHEYLNAAQRQPGPQGKPACLCAVFLPLIA
jgi:hypothetical protein